MRIEIRDASSLARLSLLDVRAYLLSRGWHEQGHYGDVATILSITANGGAEHEILLPTRRDLADYASRLKDIVETLSEVEQRSELTVFHDLVMAGYDVVRVRSPLADEIGTISFESGVSLYDQAKNMIAASANAAVTPRRVYRGNSPDKAKEYLDAIRLGQTEVGSYVLTVLSPVTPALEVEQAELFPEGMPQVDPFSRTVMKTLERALSRTRAAAVEATSSGSFDPFEAAVSDGVSANLCDAIARMADGSSGIDISLSWSPVRRPPGPPCTYSFSMDLARVLVEAATLFRAREPLADTTIEGFVIGLHRKEDEFDGRAKIRGFVEDKIRTLTAEFLLPDYSRVVDAHDRKLRVRVDGDLSKRGTSVVLKNTHNLLILEDEDANYGTDNDVY